MINRLKSATESANILANLTDFIWRLDDIPMWSPERVRHKYFVQGWWNKVFMKENDNV